MTEKINEVKRFKGSRTKEFPYYYISPPIKTMLLKAKKMVAENDWDRVYIIDGNEGSGKSLFGLQLAYFLDPTFTLDRLTFRGEAFCKSIDKAEKTQAVVLDEGFDGLSSTSALSKMNKMLVRKLMECRQKNLYIIIILPTIFLLQKYVGIFRSNALFHIYATRKGKRGYYRVYNRNNKKILYILGSKMYSYSKPYLKNTHRFSEIYPLDEAEYRKKKLDALREETKEEKMDKYSMKFASFAKLLKEKNGMKYTEMEEHLFKHGQRISARHIGRLIEQLPKTDG